MHCSSIAAGATYHGRHDDDSFAASTALGCGVDSTSSKRGRSGDAVVEEIMRLYGQSHEVLSEGDGHWILDHFYFQVSVGTLVAVNTLQLGLEMEFGDGEPMRSIFVFMEHFVTAAFCLEMSIKLFLLRGKYVKDPWNYLDSVLCLMGVLDMWIFRMVSSAWSFDLQSLSILRIMRLMRLVRVLKLMKQFRKVVLIIQGVGDAIRTTCWVALLLLLAVYVCAIFCVDTIGRGSQVASLYPGFEENPALFDDFEIISEFNPCMAFGTLGRSMLTLFNMAIMAEWSEVVKPVFFKQPWMVGFFIFFGLFITCGVMNVIIGLIVDNVMTNARAIAAIEEKCEDDEKLRLLHAIKSMFSQLDVDDDGIITHEELLASTRNGVLRKFFGEHGMRRISIAPEELLRLLDEDSSGEIDGDEFVMGMYRLLVGNDHERATSVIVLSLNQIKHSVREQMSRQGRAIHRIEEMLKIITLGVPPEAGFTVTSSGSVVANSKAGHRRMNRNATVSFGCPPPNLVSAPRRAPSGLLRLMESRRPKAPEVSKERPPAEERTFAGSPSAAQAAATDEPIVRSHSLGTLGANEALVARAASSSSSSKGPAGRPSGGGAFQELADRPEATAVSAPTPFLAANEQPEPEEEGDANSGVAELRQGQRGCAPTIQNRELEYHLGRALASMRQLESSEAFYMDAANVRQMEELTRCLDAVRHEAEAAIKNQLRETLDGCLRVVRRAVESSRPEVSGAPSDHEASSSSGYRAGARGQSPVKSRSSSREGGPSHLRAATSKSSQSSPSGEKALVQMAI